MRNRIIVPGINSDTKKQAILIFIKNPELGRVKTRLAEDLGDINALAVYKYLLDHTRQVSSALHVKRLLFYDREINYMDDWSEVQFEKVIQNGKDLGLRMFNAFCEAFDRGNKQVVIIGSDCPDISSELIQSAFENLDTHDFVLGPAKDGGYYLLGMKYPHKQIFMDKNWSTASVATHTLSDISSMGKKYFLLPELSDIDTADDLPPKLRKLMGIAY